MAKPNRQLSNLRISDEVVIEERLELLRAIVGIGILNTETYECDWTGER